MTASQPVQCSNIHFGTVPIGRPNAFDAQLFGHAFGRQQTPGNVAPFTLPTPAPYQTTMPYQRFDRRKFCEACGQPKSAHMYQGRACIFGKDKCTLTSCACGKSKDFHFQHAKRQGLAVTAQSQLMGPNCILGCQTKLNAT